ncbi:presequence translocated-associated motor subunit PAM17 [Coprinopsis cinerea okayama7|uniref:Presequence translocated-associated motor subunit PAM17 n=1 Tax=Coprinopsis cinerea (strain Okayama-7 / 130 / ATCC MYA-4618 / FGSC 9003) TaxID=240176 RepID=A8NDZ8_COPC7|nr:presequence translocated-associated motor subunit PAM17 [Coprinopsis cinerea okayama7\|eukprot:XP_001832908.1 presequence translocated-associated motor subunit PAM17 [Coprinopsis cinerea okayama7\
MSLSISRQAAARLQTTSRNTSLKASRLSRGYATAESTTAKPNAPPPKAPAKHDLTWPEYLAIRRGRRRWETAATIPAGLLGFGSGLAYFGSLETDPLKPIFGIDPFMAYGILTVACLGAGVLVGPSIGGALWRFSHRHQVHLIDAKEREFLRRIAKNRVDASLQSPTAPVPDYYGERVGSLHQYRQWLRDQNKYRRKVLLPETQD